MYSVERVIRENEGNKIVYDYHLLNSFNVCVGVFYNESLVLRVRDLLNESELND